MKSYGTNDVKSVPTDNSAKSLASLPFFEPILEDEQHVLATCPQYHHVRVPLTSTNIVIPWQPEMLLECIAVVSTLLFSTPIVFNFSIFLTKIFKIRFPEKTKKKNKKGV